MDVSSAAVAIPFPESATGINDPTEGKGNRKDMPQRRNYAWVYLMMRVFLLDVLQCGGMLAIILRCFLAEE